MRNVRRNFLLVKDPKGWSRNLQSLLKPPPPPPPPSSFFFCFFLAFGAGGVVFFFLRFLSKREKTSFVLRKIRANAKT